MAFIQFPNPTPIFPVLPPLAWSVHKKPILASRVTTAITGKATQLACAVYPRWAFTLTYGGNSWLRDRTQNSTPDPTMGSYTEFEQLSGLFLACQGSYGEFYYDDPDDDSRSGQFIGQGNGTSVSFPILCSWGSGPFSPPMYFVVGGVNVINAVYLNGVVVGAANYSLDSTKTQLIFTSPPAAGANITMDYSFYYRCRFLDDTLNFSQFAQNRWECKEVRFESVKP